MRPRFRNPIQIYGCAAELYLAYGFQNLTVRRFEKSNQPPLIVELYEMASSEDAYGVFSFEHQDETAGIGQDRSLEEGCSGSGKEGILSVSMQKGRGRTSNQESSRWEGRGWFYPPYRPGASLSRL